MGEKMANKILRISNTDSYTRWATVFKDRILDSDTKMLLVNGVSEAEFGELSKDPNVKIFDEVMIPLPDDRVKVKSPPDEEPKLVEEF